MKNASLFSKKALAVACAMALPGTALAQLEEVIVTATKRVESTQDIAMSVQAISGENLNNLAIDNFEDLSTMIPNFTVGDTLIVNQITMRGVGSGEDRGFEQSVSMFKDGVYLPRSRQTRSPFFDVDRVEVLRGPQAVLFGLNSTAGAISVHGATNRPGDEFELILTGEYEAEYSGYRVRGVAGGSLGDSLGWRLALETMDSGDGWIENDFSKDGGEAEHDIARISLVWEPTENITTTFRWEHNEAEVNGQVTEVAGGDVALPGYGDAGSLLDRFEAINTVAGALGLTPWETGGEDSRFNYRAHHSDDAAFQATHAIVDAKNYRKPLGADQEIDNVSLNVDWALGEYTLTGLFGYSDYEYDSSVNIAGLAENFYYGHNYEEYEQTSIELRLSSPLGQTFEWIAGVYYHEAELFTDQPNTFDVGKTFGLVLGLPPELIESQVLGLPPIYEILGSTLDQDSDLFSPFASVTWNISDAWRVIAGIRYSDETKDYDRDAAAPGSGVYLQNPDGSTGAFLGPFGIINGGSFAVGATSGEIDSTNTMPELMVEWDLSDDIMLFGRYAESAKAGGVATAGSTALEGLEYDDEQAESFEIGMKGRFLNGNAELNATLFSTEFTDLQVKSSAVSPDTGAVVTIIGNAGEATSEGIELDGRIAATDWLTLGGAVAWLDAEYDKYDAGPCNNSQTTPAGSLAGTCDLGGQQLPFAADFSGSVFADVYLPLGSSVNFVANLTVSYSDSYPVEGTIEDSLMQDSWTKVAGRIGIAGNDDKWSVSVIGSNLTDEEIWLGGQPLFGYNMVYPGNPRTVSVQGMYRF